MHIILLLLSVLPAYSCKEIYDNGLQVNCQLIKGEVTVYFVLFCFCFFVLLFFCYEIGCGLRVREKRDISEPSS